MIIKIDFLKRIFKALNKADIPYMLSGSIGSSFHGRPRATNDADIVIAPSQEQINAFVESLGKDYYVSLDAVQNAYKNNSMFNVIDIKTGWKADFIFRKKRAFSSEEFQRRRSVNLVGLDIWIVSPEDTILSKLEWSKNHESKQQFSDALGVAIVQWTTLDKEYLNKWAKQLQVQSSLEQLLEKAKKIIESG